MVARRIDLGGLGDDLGDLNEGEGLGALVRPRAGDTITPGTETELSIDEALELEHCETIIERGLQTFYEVGAALLRVRDLRLHRVDYSTFESYCSDRWGISRPRAYQFIESAEVRAHLSTIVDTLPTNEAQARPLTRLEPDQQVLAWQEAIQRAEELGQRLTAALVEAVVREMQPPREPAPAHAAPSDAPRSNDPQARIDAALAVLCLYEEDMARVRQYQPNSQQEMLMWSLLRALERVIFELRDKTT